MRGWSCGPASLVNACRALGKRVAEGRIRALAGTTQDGTDEHGLVRAARGVGLTATPGPTADQNAAWAFVRANVLDGRPTLLCIDSWGHWVTVIGLVGDRVIVIDPSNSKKNARENGVMSLSRTDLLKRWRHPRAEEPFYALAIGK